ncbi:MAG: hypothetical protein MPK62_06140, partial [Alphaproteobacteria bacterium]|nr:hypothetical protein [Alphaproteobacteria bacterium]
MSGAGGFLSGVVFIRRPAEGGGVGVGCRCGAAVPGVLGWGDAGGGGILFCLFRLAEPGVLW